MGARQKLNTIYFGLAGFTAMAFAILCQSWLVFVIVMFLAIVGLVHVDSIRLQPARSRTGR